VTVPGRIPAAWRRIQTGPVVDYGVLRVREDRVADPRTGAEYPRVLLDASDWVNIIPVTPDERVVLIRQFRFGIWSNTLEIPGGMTEPGEDPRDAATRELEEETGFRAEHVVPLGWVHANPALLNNRVHSFLALGCRKVHEGLQETSEDIAVELRPRGDIPGLILGGDISHSLVVAAFYLEAQQRAL
jgi:ADP-ribose pyrophosphatase